MDWIAKIITGTPDEFVHAKMVKYGIGEHTGPRMKLSLTQSKVNIKADLDLEKVLARIYISCIKEGRHRVTGNIIRYTEPPPQPRGVQVPLDWSKVKGAGATIFKARLDEVIPGEYLSGLLEYDSPTTFFLLSLTPLDSASGSKVTIKSSFPKGGAAGAVDEEDTEEAAAEGMKDPTFAKATFDRTSEVDDLIMREILPDVRQYVGPKTKKIEIYHTIVIDNIEIPDDPRLSISDKRRLAKKTGRLTRRVVVDDKEYVFTYPFKA